MSIQQVIENEDFYHVFQPIFEINNWSKIGYEVLLRTSFSANPEIAFQEAKREKRLFELDSLSMQKAVRSYFSEGPQTDGYLFINVFPSSIVHPDFLSVLKTILTEKSLHSHQENTKIVLEIAESEIISDTHFEAFKEKIAQIKEHGILIAIDDIGKGYNALQLLIEIAPNFLKLDRYFAKDLCQSKQKQTMIDLLIKYCDQYNCKLILEGIEKDVELAAAKYIGVRFTQGYLLGRPGVLE
ncbi:EAL domain-containing protein [Neobacillus ginsengisoli]|uniref:EAL domain-containing protein (Putative c-di-GMP-specific phosphodiesterase class I) n=1 Tax=Neobacillus ginsengisoli TaxID=904295 RepID=A0ABT9XW72_9BACI|nr:EAL domain-containing protein [Neobacillus ginsengisoli]MDQ0199184.1 EAL domain-containing protein (putative c-di-GMP-specific phosphodiesterase class I) [Neobacillus ginsengisoli]